MQDHEQMRPDLSPQKDEAALGLQLGSQSVSLLPGHVPAFSKWSSLVLGSNGIVQSPAQAPKLPRFYLWMAAKHLLLWETQVGELLFHHLTRVIFF